MTMKRTVTAIGMAVAVSIGAFAQTGYDVMKRVNDGSSPETTHALFRMVVADSQGNESERVIEEWSAKDTAGNRHTVMVFHSPASVRNTRFLVQENDGRDDDQWIYLPSLNRVRRIAAGEKGGSFVGTEFSYYDLGPRDIDGFTHALVGTEEAQGYECFIVESRATESSDSPYAKTVSWITVDEKVNTVVKIEIYENEETLLKVMTVGSVEKSGDYRTPVEVTMRNAKNGRSTTLYRERIEYDAPVNPARFTVRFLETGRAQ